MLRSAGVCYLDAQHCHHQAESLPTIRLRAFIAHKTFIVPVAPFDHGIAAWRYLITKRLIRFRFVHKMLKGTGSGEQ